MSASAINRTPNCGSPAQARLLTIERLSDELSEVIKSLEISLRFGTSSGDPAATKAASLPPTSDGAASSPSKLIKKRSVLRRLWRRLTIGGSGGHGQKKEEKNTKLKIPRSISCPVKNDENRSVKVNVKDMKRLKEICINLQQCLKWPSESTPKNSSAEIHEVLKSFAGYSNRNSMHSTPSSRKIFSARSLPRVVIEERIEVLPLASDQTFEIFKNGDIDTPANTFPVVSVFDISDQQNSLFKQEISVWDEVESIFSSSVKTSQAVNENGLVAHSGKTSIHDDVKSVYSAGIDAHECSCCCHHAPEIGSTEEVSLESCFSSDGTLSAVINYAFHDGPDSCGFESGNVELSGNCEQHLLQSAHSTKRSDSCSKVSLQSFLNAGDSNLMSAKSYLCRSDYDYDASRRCLCPVFQDRNSSRSVPGLNLLHVIHCSRLSISTPDLLCVSRLDDRKHEVLLLRFHQHFKEKLADLSKLFLLLGYLLALIFRAIRNLESSLVAAGEKLAVTFKR